MKIPDLRIIERKIERLKAPGNAGNRRGKMTGSDQLMARLAGELGDQAKAAVIFYRFRWYRAIVSSLYEKVR